MTADQLYILTILVVTIAMFLWGRWRHDIVAVMALLTSVVLGLVAPANAFTGFGHPAVITVACVLILSRGLQNSGAIDLLSRWVLPGKAGPMLSIAAITLLGAVLSGFMNNVGALALLMPMALQLANRLKLPAGKVLMPLAFSSILGGTTTLIGTPPNLIVSGFRAQHQGMEGFGLFDFTLVGLPLAIAGVLFITLLGWRLVPVRKEASAAGFETSAYITEARVPEGSAAANKRLYEVESILGEADAQIVGLVRNEVRVTAPQPGRLIFAGDILVIEADVAALPEVLSKLGLQLEEDKQQTASETKGAEQERVTEQFTQSASLESAPAKGGEENEQEKKPADEIVLMEMVVLPASAIGGRSASDLLLRSRYGINLLALSREGQRSMVRLRSLKIQPGDVLLMQGPPEALIEFASTSGCLPLAARELRIPERRKVVIATGIMVITMGVVALGWLPPAIAFAMGVLASMVLRTVPARSAYEAVDWSIIVLLATLLPVSLAMQETGVADLIARFLLDNLANGDPVIALAVILITTMTLTDLMNNAAIAAIMAPIGLGFAAQLGVNEDTFLMAVAIGASCSFLTPIGHQNNTLILGPGGFRFSDYWRLGLPLEILLIVVALPLLLVVWPLASV